MAFVRRHWPLLAALAIGLALRVALWERLPRLGLIGDEAEYLASGDWLAAGRGFAWHTQYLWTRAPLYPLFVAGHVALFGRELGPIFVSQSLLSLLNVALIYALARMVAAGTAAERAAPGYAALLAAIYLPLASYAQLLLSETLFITLLLGAFLALGRWAAARRRGWLWLGLAGVLLGLATLTRGLTLAFVPVVALWVIWVALAADGADGASSRSDSGHRAALPMALAQAGLLPVAFCLTVLPWSVYASRAYGGTILVDTTGAFNLALGARTAYDGGRSDEPTRNFVLALLDPALSQEQRVALLAERREGSGRLVRPAACLYTAGDPRLLAALARPVGEISQGQRQQLLMAEALCLLRANPTAFVAKSVREFIDLFKINYTGAERLSNGFALGRLPQWYMAALFLLDDTLYVLVLPLAILGWAVLRLRGLRGLCGSKTRHALLLLIGLWLLYNLAAAPLLFAINRFRVPLLPFAFVLAGCALAMLPALVATLRTRYGALCGVLAGLLLLVATAPYAYFEPIPPGGGSRWASYLGPYPSSLSITTGYWGKRAGFEREQALAAALGAGDVPRAQAALAAPELPGYAAAVGAPLLDGLEGRPAAGLDRLARSEPRPLEPWQTSVVAGELFRQLGDLDAARRELNPELVDRENPVAWAWAWLFPPRLPADRIELADDNDLGYIRGFSLGEFDGTLGATVRWGTGETALRFPEAASGAPRSLCLNLAAAWPADLAPPTVTVLLDGDQIGTLSPGPVLEERCLLLPARPAGAGYTIELRSPTFVPDALDLLRQQGPLVGQLRQLAFQLDYAEVRD